MRLPFPIESDAELLLEGWDSAHEQRFVSLLIRYSKLSLAIAAQKSASGLITVNQALEVEGALLFDTFLDLEGSIIPRLRNGYGNEHTFALYRNAVSKIPLLEQAYRQQRDMFSVYLDAYH